MTLLILSVALTIICFVGLAFNGYIVLVILLTRQVNGANNILLLHLGIVNVLIGCLFLIFCLPGVKGTEWASAGAPCAVNGFFFTLLHSLALWTICGLNCDRYYAIASPLHYSHIVSTKKVFMGLVAGWINSFVLAIPPLFNATPYRYLSELGACAPDFKTGTNSIWYASAYTGFTLLVPATVLVCCNAKILVIARYHRHRIASAILEVALSAQVTITHQPNPFFVPIGVTSPAAGGPKVRGSNPILAVFVLVGSFLTICLPYYVLVMYEAVAHTLTTKLETAETGAGFYVAAGTLLICSPAVNGYLYGLKNKSLRKAFTNYWRKKQTKNEVHHEIQARTPSTCGSRRPSLTPFGLFVRNNVSRRLSETLIDVNKSLKSQHKSEIKRITSEVMWRPTSASDLSTLSPQNEPSTKKTISCNTLRVPEEFDEYVANEENNPDKLCNSTGTLLQKVFKFEQQDGKEETGESKCKRSPRILITRAYSEESEKSSQNNSPSRDIHKKHSTSASTLIEKKWRHVKYQKDEDTDSDCAKSTKPLLTSYVSSETSGSSAKFPTRGMSIEKYDTDSTNEDQVLLNWCAQKKYQRPEDARRTSPKLGAIKVQCKEIVL